jgi:hypothetical protein
VFERVNSSCRKIKEYAGGSLEMEEQVRRYIAKLRITMLGSATV